MVSVLESLVSGTNSKIAVTSASIIAAVAVSGVILWLQQRKKSIHKIPTKWKPIGKIQQIFIYPLKSAKANEVSEAECTPLGLKEVSNGEEKYLLQDRQVDV